MTLSGKILEELDYGHNYMHSRDSTIYWVKRGYTSGCHWKAVTG